MGRSTDSGRLAAFREHSEQVCDEDEKLPALRSRELALFRSSKTVKALPMIKDERDYHAAIVAEVLVDQGVSEARRYCAVREFNEKDTSKIMAHATKLLRESTAAQEEIAREVSLQRHEKIFHSALQATDERGIPQYGPALKAQAAIDRITGSIEEADGAEEIKQGILMAMKTVCKDEQNPATQKAQLEGGH